jgi:metallo-beta-lactamase class B
MRRHSRTGTTAENAPLIERNIEALGVPLHTVRLLVSDHAHHDHVGAMAQIKRDTGAEFLASAGDKWALEHGCVRGDATLTAHLTPGHTPGCTSWTSKVLNQGRQLNVIFLCSITVARQTSC